ncbi:hypothetical protein [Cystobacter fuscus]|uniref:hypothetical protein n=1 Tax=Cystobacter fuscus TaxID=43 RepID=UPI002B2BF9E3|nr:hypothetical protein F0U63_25730 [Cystobacter fuscus]
MGDILLSDLLLALMKLQPADLGTSQQIAGFLGLGWIDTINHQNENVKEVEGIHRRDSNVSRDASAIQLESLPVLSTDSAPDNADWAETTIEALKQRSLPPPYWFNSVQAMPAPSPTRGSTTLEPLFEPALTRNLLTAALQTERNAELIDLEKIIVQLSRGEPLYNLPVERLPTLSKGVQVLVDKSEAMLPFSRDQKELLVQLRRVIGFERVQVDVFNGLPEHVLTRSGSRLVSPLPGTPVLLLTDLRVGGSAYSKANARVEDWLVFARRLAQRGCPVVAFVPYPPSRWPTPLRHVIRIVQWDRRTTVAQVRARMRCAREG